MQSEALSMHYGSSGLLIFLLSYPIRLESRQRTQNRTTDPHQKLPFSWSNHLDFHRRWDHGCQFFAESFRDARVHGGTSTHDNVAEKLSPDVDVTLGYGVVAYLV